MMTDNIFFDSHAHYDDARFNEDRDALLTTLPSMGVAGIVNAGSSVASSKASVLLAEAFPYIYAAVGVHPHDANELTDEGLAGLEDLCRHEKVVAVGEIGLDFYYDYTPRDIQRFWFEQQLAMALRVDKPVVVHAREASAETFERIKQSGVRRGVIHCFSGGAPLAAEYVKLGFYIGVGGVVTFDKTRKLPEVVAAVSLDHFLIETDAPYQTPKPHRGKRNDSSYLRFIADTIAQIKGVATEEVAERTRINAEKLFALPRKACGI